VSNFRIRELCQSAEIALLDATSKQIVWRELLIVSCWLDLQNFPIIKQKRLSLSADKTIYIFVVVIFFRQHLPGEKTFCDKSALREKRQDLLVVLSSVRQ